jgi:hypothetical protein
MARASQPVPPHLGPIPNFDAGAGRVILKRIKAPVDDLKIACSILEVPEAPVFRAKQGHREG